MYDLVVFLHVMSVLLFMLVHGVSMMVMFVLERQEQPEQLRDMRIRPVVFRKPDSVAGAHFGQSGLERLRKPLPSDFVAFTLT